jgi:hypothetical protein
MDGKKINTYKEQEAILQSLEQVAGGYCRQYNYAYALEPAQKALELYERALAIKKNIYGEKLPPTWKYKLTARGEWINWY